MLVIPASMARRIDRRRYSLNGTFLIPFLSEVVVLVVPFDTVVGSIKLLSLLFLLLLLLMLLLMLFL